ncbi:MAG: hypothetical protein QXQ91_01900 [Nanopusillaceae archaeon]
MDIQSIGFRAILVGSFLVILYFFAELLVRVHSIVTHGSGVPAEYIYPFFLGFWVGAILFTVGVAVVFLSVAVGLAKYVNEVRGSKGVKKKKKVKEYDVDEDEPKRGARARVKK